MCFVLEASDRRSLFVSLVEVDVVVACLPAHPPLPPSWLLFFCYSTSGSYSTDEGARSDQHLPSTGTTHDVDRNGVNDNNDEDGGGGGGGDRGRGRKISRQFLASLSSDSWQQHFRYGVEQANEEGEELVTSRPADMAPFRWQP